MRFRKLGDSDIEVSEISLGSWLTYGAGVEREQTEACTRAAFDAGINFFDTSNIYGVGAAETAWGEILSDFPRDSYVLATKVYFPMSETDRGLSREQIHKQLDASLERLQTDYVDLYQCHRPDPGDADRGDDGGAHRGRRAPARFARSASREWTVEQIEAGLEVPGARKWVSSQPQYNMIWRAPEAELIPFCAEHGISQIVWSPLAQGVLTGKYRPGEPPPAGLPRRQRRDERLDRPLHGGRGARGGPAAGARSRRARASTMVEMALAWVLREPNVASAIIGASRPEQVHANARGLGGRAVTGRPRRDRRGARRPGGSPAPARRLRPGGRQAPLTDPGPASAYEAGSA